MKQSPHQLVRLCLKRDLSAWEEFVKRYAPLIYWAIERTFRRSRFSFRQEDLEDTFQQVFSHLWEKGLKSAEGVERIEGWLAIVSYRVAVDVVRRDKKRDRLVSLNERIGENEGSEKRIEDLLPDHGKNPREKLEGKLLEEAVNEILNSLSEKEALILRLNLIEEKTHSEISELLKVPIGTISSLVKRTKEEAALRFKKRLGEG